MNTRSCPSCVSPSAQNIWLKKEKIPAFCVKRKTEFSDFVNSKMNAPFNYLRLPFKGFVSGQPFILQRPTGGRYRPRWETKSSECACVGGDAIRLLKLPSFIRQTWLIWTAELQHKKYINKSHPDPPTRSSSWEQQASSGHCVVFPWAPAAMIYGAVQLYCSWLLANGGCSKTSSVVCAFTQRITRCQTAVHAFLCPEMAL